MVKVEQNIDEKTKIITLTITGNKEDDVDTIDILRAAIMGNHVKRGGYVDSKTLVIEINPELEG